MISLGNLMGAKSQVKSKRHKTWNRKKNREVKRKYLTLGGETESENPKYQMEVKKR